MKKSIKPHKPNPNLDALIELQRETTPKDWDAMLIKTRNHEHTSKGL